MKKLTVPSAIYNKCLLVLPFVWLYPYCVPFSGSYSLGTYSAIGKAGRSLSFWDWRILILLSIGRYLRSESLGFVPVFEFLFTGVCRREQKLEVKICKVGRSMAENLLLSVSSSTFCGTLLTHCFGQQPTSFWTADNLCRSNTPSRGSWIGRIVTQGERHSLFLYVFLSLKGSLGLMRYFRLTVSGYSRTGEFLFITFSFCVFWSYRECGMNAWWGENNMLRLSLDQ